MSNEGISSMTSTVGWKTRLTLSRFPCSIPLIGAPMADVSGGRLAAETCRAGAMGFLAAGHLQNVPALEQEIALFRKLSAEHKTDYPLCLGFICHSTFRDGSELFKSVMNQHRPAVVQFFAPAVVHLDNATTNIKLAQSYNALVLAQVGTYGGAREALEAGADGLIVQGVEAGGHGYRRDLGNGTLSLATAVVSLAAPYNVPVLAAGGIADGTGVAAALAMGCDGAVLGTRLWASKEALGKDEYKQRLVDAESCDEVIRTTVFDQIQNSFSSAPWPQPYDSMWALRNENSSKWEGRSDEDLATAIKEGSLVNQYRQAQDQGNSNLTPVLSGEGVGNVKSVDSAYDIVIRTSQEAAETIEGLNRLVTKA